MFVVPARDPQGHKYTFGRVGIIAGSCAHGVWMPGAAALCARGAMRAGCGLAQVIAPRPVLRVVLSGLPSATGHAIATDRNGLPDEQASLRALERAIEQCAVLCIGPGLGVHPSTRAVVLRALSQEHVPIILDADGINALAHIAEFWKDMRAKVILTPHEGEFARLAGALSVPSHLKTRAAREDAARAMAQRLGCVVVLKGPGTVVSCGVETRVCTLGGAELATGGTGDVLAGAISGLLAGQRAARPEPSIHDLFEAAWTGVNAHAKAGEVWSSRARASAGMLAHELADVLPEALESMR